MDIAALASLMPVMREIKLFCFLAFLLYVFLSFTLLFTHSLPKSQLPSKYSILNAFIPSASVSEDSPPPPVWPATFQADFQEVCPQCHGTKYSEPSHLKSGRVSDSIKSKAALVAFFPALCAHIRYHHHLSCVANEIRVTSSYAV